MRRLRKIHFEKAAFHAAGKAHAFRERFKSAGWTGIWTDTIYDYTHFHSNAHEVLGIAEGKVTLRLGGDERPYYGTDGPLIEAWRLEGGRPRHCL